ncbi:MAG TPA: succinate dehydrogenase flavoprotein subunit [Polyangia bacterium]|jgi:succinate dehydrogenase / fumarate reductase flavoprotein subunit|nr:succinate dehydrogenase flavoprotein subunit [Polyangia bacterium]
MANPAVAADKPRFIVVGGGLAGLMAVIKIAEAGYDCDVFSFVPCRRSHSVCAQGGINGAVNTKGEGDSPALHFKDSIKGGDFLADQPPVKAMCDAAPGVIYLLDRMGVPFTRTSEGLIDFRRFGGTLHNRTAFAGATTGQQLLYALDEQVRRHEVDGRVRRFEHWEYVHTILDDAGHCRGIVAMDLYSMKLESFPAAAVCLATGGPGIIYGKSTNSVVNTGTAAAVAYQQGAIYANGEFIQVHPTSIPGADKLRLISESLRGEGARVWVSKQKGDTRHPNQIPMSERWYFLEEKYPRYKNLVPRDVASREIFHVCREMGLGISGQDAVYLDIVNPDFDVSKGRGPDEIARRVEGVVEIYETFMGEDPRKVPMKVFPGVHYSMGGLWIDYEQMTNIPGLFAAGEVDFAYHGANRLGANSLVSCIYGGMIAGPAMIRYATSKTGKELGAPPSVLLDRERQRMQEEYDRIGRMDGPVNPYSLWWKLGYEMTGKATVVRHNDQLRKLDEQLVQWMDEWKKCSVLDTGKTANQAIMFVRQLWNMLVLARVIVRGALLRDESRGSHYKPEFAKRDDERFLKTTMASYDAADHHGPKITYKDVDISLMEPELRDYTGDGTKTAAPAAKTGAASSHSTSASLSGGAQKAG